ncbi:MAG: phosphoribosylanthranilate isomerase [Planctomyces sp.]|nr:phosphoribosylanthranilate isomerase [Planctomyces sp.]
MWVKICGIGDVDMARRVAELRPDAIGLNFYPNSPRFVDPRMAERICRALPVDVEPVGVFVNEPAEDIARIAAHCGIRTVQLHGDEPPEDAARLGDAGLDVIRAWRVDAEALPRLADEIAAHRPLRLKAILVDARVAGQYGGSGQVAPWRELATVWEKDWPPLILAGGLTPRNVAEAVSATRPWGVDTASGVESSPGVKDLDQVRAFLAAARSA